MKNNPPHTDNNELSSDKRQQIRYPSVGISLVYSALTHQNINNLAEYLYSASSNDLSLSGLSFDTYQQLNPGEKLILLISIPEQNSSERLMTEVRWCKQLSKNIFRIGVKIDLSETISHDNPGNHVNIPVNTDSVPAEIELRCPACMENVTFEFVERQYVPDKGNMPLYNCSNCGSTRSLMGILASNRKQAKK